MMKTDLQYHSSFQVAKNMGSVVKSLDKAINSMELQKISEVMDKFESQFEDLDVRSAVKIISNTLIWISSFCKLTNSRILTTFLEISGVFFS